MLPTKQTIKSGLVKSLSPYPPQMLLMENGTLVCVSGHEHNFLIFSDDLGKTWSEPYIIEECYGKWGNSPSGYNTIVESALGEITMIYDDPKEMIAQNAPDGYKRQIYVRTLRIERVL